MGTTELPSTLPSRAVAFLLGRSVDCVRRGDLDGIRYDSVGGDKQFYTHELTAYLEPLVVDLQQDLEQVVLDIVHKKDHWLFPASALRYAPQCHNAAELYHMRGLTRLSLPHSDHSRQRYLLSAATAIAEGNGPKPEGDLTLVEVGQLLGVTVGRVSASGWLPIVDKELRPEVRRNDALDVFRAALNSEDEPSAEQLAAGLLSGEDMLLSRSQAAAWTGQPIHAFRKRVRLGALDGTYLTLPNNYKCFFRSRLEAL